MHPVAQVVPVPGVVSERNECLEKFEKIVNRNHPEHYYKKSDLLKLLTLYSTEKLNLIYDDYCDIRKNCFSDLSTDKKTYIATAGAPASGKSTLLEKR